MIQFNLLPDVKIEFIRTQRTKRMVILGALGLAGLSIGLLLVMVSYSAVQDRHIGNLDKDIKSITEELESNEELTSILSVQNQLQSLPALYNGRPAASRLPQYLDQTTPTGVGIGRLIIDFSANSMEIAGTAPTLEAINNYIDTLKFTTFKAGDESGSENNAFTGVVLSEFGRDDSEATFVVTLIFNPQIFDATKSIELTVPNKVTTRAQAPAASTPDLFDGSVPEETDE